MISESMKESRLCLMGCVGWGLALVLFGCSLKQADSKLAEISVRLGAFGEPAPAMSQVGIFGFFPHDFTPPVIANGFNCYAVNIVGPGISPRGAGDSKQSPEATLAQMYQGSHCAYPGISSLPLTSGGPKTVSLSVPTGPGRIVQVMGVDDPSGELCSINYPLAESNLGDTSHVYEIGRSVVDLFSDRAVVISNSYNGISAANRRLRQADCSSEEDLKSPDLVLWLRASSITGVADGATIAGNWNDESGLGISLTPTGTQPVFEAGNALINGHPYIVFSGGATTQFQGTGKNLGMFDGGSLFFVARLIADPATVSTNNSGYDFYVNFSGGNKSFTVDDLGTLATATTTSNGGFRIYSNVWTRSTEQRMYEIGELTSTSAGSFPANLVDMTNATINIGNSPTGNIEIAEVLIYKKALSPAAREKVAFYLSQKYQLP